MRIIYRFLRDESAATAVEYGLIAAGIGLTIVVALNALGSSMSSTFSSLSTDIK